MNQKVGIDFSATDQEFLDRHAGVQAAAADELAALEARSAAQAAKEAASTLSRQEVAARLGVDVSRVPIRLRPAPSAAIEGAEAGGTFLSSSCVDAPGGTMTVPSDDPDRASDVQGLEEVVNVRRVRGEHLAAGTVLGRQRNECIENVGGTGLTQQLAGTP